MRSKGAYVQVLANKIGLHGENIDGRQILLRQVDVGPPVLSAWLRLGGPVFCRHALDLDRELPPTIRAGVFGHCLGNLVAAGPPDIDAQAINAVESWNDCQLIIGPPRRSRASGPNLIS